MAFMAQGKSHNYLTEVFDVTNVIIYGILALWHIEKNEKLHFDKTNRKKIRNE